VAGVAAAVHVQNLPAAAAAVIVAVAVVTIQLLQVLKVAAVVVPSIQEPTNRTLKVSNQVMVRLS
jgi:hypothetical protein